MIGGEAVLRQDTVTPDEKAARVEQIELLATTINTAGISVVVSGAVLPTIVLLYGGEHPKVPLWRLIGLWWLSLGAGTHIDARSILRSIAR